MNGPTAMNSSDTVTGESQGTSNTERTPRESSTGMCFKLMSCRYICNTFLDKFLLSFLLELVSALDALSIYDKSIQDAMKSAVEHQLDQNNPASYIPSNFSVAGARRYFFCSGCQRLDLEATLAQTSVGQQVTLCSYCYNSEGKCPMWESHRDGHVGVPTAAEKRARKAYNDSDSVFTMEIIQTFIDGKIHSGLSYDDLAEKLQNDCPLLEGKWTKSRVSKLWNNGEGCMHLSQLTRDCKTVPIKDILERDESGALTSQIKNEYRQDCSNDFSPKFYKEVLYSGLLGRGGGSAVLYSGLLGRGGGSATRRSNVALRLLYPVKSDQGNWILPAALSELAPLSQRYEHLEGKTDKLRRSLCLVAMFELLFDKARRVLEVWSPSGIDLGSVDWNDSTSITIEVKRDWLALVVDKLGLCCGKLPTFLDLSGSTSSAVRAEQNHRVEDANASELLADLPRILDDLQFRKDKVRLNFTWCRFFSVDSTQHNTLSVCSRPGG